MADPIADNADFAVDELKRKARRRLVGAIVLALAAATILPLLLEQEQKPLGGEVSVQIPAIDGGGTFVSRLKADKDRDAAPEAKPDAGAPKDSPENGSPALGSAAPPADATASSGGASIPSGDAAPAAPAPDESGSRGSRPGGKAEPKAAPKSSSKADTKPPVKAAVAPAAHEAAPESKPAPITTAAAPASLAQAAPASPPSPVPTSPAPAPPTSLAPAAPASLAPAATPAPSAARAPEAPEPPGTAATVPPAARGLPAESPKMESYVVQLGAFTDNYGANALASKLKKVGYPAYTEPVETSRGTLWRVRVGSYPTRQAAAAARNKLKADGHIGVVAAATK